MSRILGLIFLLPIAAWAQSPSEMALQPLGRNLICYTTYPSDAFRHNQVGTATLLLRVGADGHVTGVIVASSSGHDILDRESVACAKTWQFRPALREGQPVEAPASATIQWAIETSPERSALGLRPPFDFCLPPEDAVGRHGVTVISYSVKNGEVSHVAIEDSSGDTALDRQASRCVSAWHFEPQTVEPTVAVIASRVAVIRPGEPTPAAPRSPESLSPHAVSGHGIAKFDWEALGAH